MAVMQRKLPTMNGRLPAIERINVQLQFEKLILDTEPMSRVWTLPSLYPGFLPPGKDWFWGCLNRWQ